MKRGAQTTYLILDNIRSIHNVGSIFRTAACAGVEKIYLTGCTGAPVDRFGRVRNDFKKVSLGAEIHISYIQKENTLEAIEELRKGDVSIVSVEQDRRSVLLENFAPPERVAYILGNEVGGIGEEVLSFSDNIVEIPINKEAKESLNVSVAAGIILFCV